MKTEALMTRNNIYVLPAGKTANDVAVNLKHFLITEEGMDAQILKLENESYFIQARARCGKLKQFAGLDKVTAVKLTPINNTNIIVEIGKGKWKDKILCGAIGWFISWPFAVTTVIGSYKQGSLRRKIVSNIECFLAS